MNLFSRKQWYCESCDRMNSFNYKHCNDCKKCHHEKFKYHDHEKKNCYHKRFEWWFLIFGGGYSVIRIYNEEVYCAKCKSYIETRYNVKKHCDACNKCVLDFYKHCDKCNKCVKNAYIHCDTCKKCLPTKHCKACDNHANLTHGCLNCGSCHDANFVFCHKCRICVHKKLRHCDKQKKCI